MERKVLFTASTYSHIAHFHRPYLRAFAAQGWTVDVACGGEPGELPGVRRVIPLPFQKSFTSPGNFRAAGLLRREIRAEGYGFISTHTSLAAFFTRLALTGLENRPIVANMVHGYLFDDETPAPKRAVLMAAERLTAPVTDLLLTMNRWDHELAKKCRLGRKVVHIPGVGVDFSQLESNEDLRAQYGLPRDAFLLVYAAEFSPRKSQSVLIRAMARLPENAVLALPGDGALRQECETLAAQLGLSGRVLFPGYVPHIAGWYAAADGAVTASRSEGLPFNVMEAMYLGLPTVASAVKGHTDLIENGVNGLLYPYGDVDSCADQLLRLMDSPALRNQLGQAAHASAEQYSLEKVFPQVWAAYAGVVPELDPDLILSAQDIGR